MAQKETKSTDGGKASAPAKTKPNGASPSNSDELLEAIANEAFEPAKPQSTFLRAFRDIFLVAALLAGGMYYYYGYVTVKEEVAKLAKGAVDFVKKDDLISLRKAEEKYLEILKLDSDNKVALSALAEVYFHMTRHGENKLSDAEANLAKAISAKAETPERYAADAYLKIWKGQHQAAADDVSKILEKGFYSSKLAHALGWAKMEMGEYNDANRILKQAAESDFASVQIQLTLAEVAHRQGRDRAAITSISKIIDQRTMNPDHVLALAWSAALRAQAYGNLERPIQILDEVGKRFAGKGGPVGEAYTDWAAGELALALQNAKGALDLVESASKKYGKPFPPFLDLKARALAASGDAAGAIQAWQEGISAKPTYHGLKWHLAEFYKKRGDNGALALIEELEKADKGMVGPEYEIFRGDFFIQKGELEKAKEHYTKAADLGDDAKILLGMAKVSFAEESKKGAKADLDRIQEDLGACFERQFVFPEANELMADISLWNFMVPAAGKAFEDAEGQYKKMKRPVSELVDFFDRAIAKFKGANDKQIAKEAEKMASDWEKRKSDYLASVAAGTN